MQRNIQRQPFTTGIYVGMCRHRILFIVIVIIGVSLFFGRPLHSYFRSLCTVVINGFFKPRMLERRLCCDTLFGIVLKYLAKEVEKLFVECVVSGDDLLNNNKHTSLERHRKSTYV